MRALAWTSGAAAGLAGTVTMTAAMFVMQRLLPPRQREPLEPRQVTEGILDRSGADDAMHLDEDDVSATTAVSHFGYGATMGAAYALVEPHLPLPSGARGPAFGLLVWGASYAGWLPAMDILPPPQRRPAARNALMIAAHLVWGATVEWVHLQAQSSGSNVERKETASSPTPASFQRRLEPTAVR